MCSCSIPSLFSIYTSVNNDFKKKNEKKFLPLIPDKRKDQMVMKISPQLELATFTYLRFVYAFTRAINTFYFSKIELRKRGGKSKVCS